MECIIVTHWEAELYVKYVPVLTVIGLSVALSMLVYGLIGRRSLIIHKRKPQPHRMDKGQ